MSLKAWNERVRASRSWALKSVSLSVLEDALHAQVHTVSVLDGSPLRLTNLKNLRGNICNDSYILVDNTLPTSGLCAPGLFDVDLILETIDFESGSEIYLVGLGKKSTIKGDVLKSLISYLDTASLELNGEDLESNLSDLEVEVKAQSENARVVSEFLSCHPSVSFVSYIGNKEHPDYQMASQTLRGGFTGYIEFMPRCDSSKIEAFCDALVSKDLDVEMVAMCTGSSDECFIRMKVSSQSSIEQIEILEHELSSFKQV